MRSKTTRMRSAIMWFFASVYRNQTEIGILVLGSRIYPITAFLNKAYEAINGFIFVNIALHHLFSLI